MRLSLVLLAALAMIGCGAGTVTQPHRVVGSAVFPPSISMLSPNTVPVNSAPFTTTVVGTNFGADVLVYWNNTPLTTMPINSRQLMAQLNALDLQTVGLVPVFVRTGEAELQHRKLPSGDPITQAQKMLFGRPGC